MSHAVHSHMSFVVTCLRGINPSVLDGDLFDLLFCTDSSGLEEEADTVKREGKCVGWGETESGLALGVELGGSDGGEQVRFDAQRKRGVPCWWSGQHGWTW